MGQSTPKVIVVKSRVLPDLQYIMMMSVILDSDEYLSPPKKNTVHHQLLKRSTYITHTYSTNGS